MIYYILDIISNILDNMLVEDSIVDNFFIIANYV
jgi:hypothetical protein